jgi:hypothetical protein
MPRRVRRTRSRSQRPSRSKKRDRSTYLTSGSEDQSSSIYITGLIIHFISIHPSLYQKNTTTIKSNPHQPNPTILTRNRQQSPSIPIPNFTLLPRPPRKTSNSLRRPHLFLDNLHHRLFPFTRFSIPHKPNPPLLSPISKQAIRRESQSRHWRFGGEGFDQLHCDLGCLCSGGRRGLHAPDLDALVAAGGREDGGSVRAVFGVGGSGGCGRPGAVEDHARVAFGVGFQEGVSWRRSSRIILAACSVRLEKHPLPIAADTQQEAIIRRKGETGDSEGMR